ncbi:MAG: IclR family transcriptional regulator [Betaproteobacteria bacterium]|nr:IclR family transcriptional regulator [Betaproteobacteria bacterium]
MGSSLARLLSTVDIFSQDAPVWTVGAIAAKLGYTRATAYRYVGELCDAGLLTRIAQGAYALGPRIIELDRQIRHGDPFLRAGERVMQALLRPNRGQVVLLCSLFRDRVLCTHQASRDTELALSYTRGRPMPLFRGATSKVILAWLPERRLTRLFLENQAEIRKAGLGRTREEFLAALKTIRRQGCSVTHAEIDPGVIGIAAPVFDGERSVIGSLSIVFPEDRFPKSRADRLAAELKRAAESIRVELGKLAEAPRREKGRSRKQHTPRSRGEISVS